MGLNLLRALRTGSKNIPKIISLFIVTSVLFCVILKSMKFPIARQCIYRIIQWVIVILCSALILYIVITEERFAPEGCGFDDTEEIISEAHKELLEKPLK